MLPYQFEEIIRAELQEIAPELTVREAHDIFTIWFVSKYLDCPLPEADDAFVGGANDFGIDAIYIPSVDEGQQVVAYIVQTKYSNEAINADIVNSLRAKQDWLLKPLPDEMNSRVRAKWAEMSQRLFQSKGKVRFVIATLGSFTDASEASSRELFSSVYVDCMDLYDFDTLLALFYPGFDNDIDNQLLVTKAHDLEAKSIMAIEGEEVKAWLAVVPLIKIAHLPEINSKRLFAANVRYEISRAAVKTGIKKSIANDQSRRRFFLHHNGITIVARKVLKKRNNVLELRGFSVVNGCQSVIAISQADQQHLLKQDSTVLVRLYETGDPELMRDISEYTNTQTAVQQRDLRSNTNIQRSLRENFFKSSVHYIVKRGEAKVENKHCFRGTIPNELAAQILYSFEHQLPHRAHRKDTLFSVTLHEAIFGTSSVEQIYVLWCLYEEIKKAMADPELSVPDHLADNAIAALLTLASVKGSQRWPENIEKWPSIERVYDPASGWSSWFEYVARLAVTNLKLTYKEEIENAVGEFDRIAWLKDANTIGKLKKEFRRFEGTLIASSPKASEDLKPPF